MVLSIGDKQILDWEILWMLVEGVRDKVPLEGVVCIANLF